MLQRLIIAFSLIVSLGAAQIGAISHELSHYQNIHASLQTASNINDDAATKSTSDPIDSLPHTQVCEKCVSYAEVHPLLYQNAITSFSPPDRQHFVHLNSQSYQKSFTASYAARAPPYFA
jgi:hypothetical protein